MDELEISGRRYISSKQAAKEHKYHADYIGQLVRGGKVAGQKVGRAWYVDAVSLAEYLGKEVPARGPIKVAQKQEPEPIKNTAPHKVARFEVEEVIEEKVTFERTTMQTPEEPEFALPFRKSGRAHTIAAIETTQNSKPKVEPKKIVQPIVKESEPISSFSAEVPAEDAEMPMQYSQPASDETYIPLKITRNTTQEISEPEDSFYKVSQKGLRYVSQNAPLVPKLSQKEEAYYPPVLEREARTYTKPKAAGEQRQNGKAKIMRAITIVLIAGIVALGAGVLASYYLHSVTTVAGQGQSGGLFITQ